MGPQTPDLVAKCLVGYPHSHDLLRRIRWIDLPIIRHTGLERHVTIERLDGYTYIAQSQVWARREQDSSRVK
jgi:hypothetical protein